jgi:DNA-directed RNA polymerase subunit RPC12/RpoP
MYKCSRCGNEFTSDWGGCVRINEKELIELCGSCMFKVQTLLKKTDYEWIRDALTRTGYDNDIESHDEDHYFVLSAYGNKVAVEFDEDGEFAKITEAE